MLVEYNWRTEKRFRKHASTIILCWSCVCKLTRNAETLFVDYKLCLKELAFLGTGEMTQTIKYLLSKHEDPSSDPQHPCKKVLPQNTSEISTGESETEGS